MCSLWLLYEVQHRLLVVFWDPHLDIPLVFCVSRKAVFTELCVFVHPKLVYAYWNYVS